MKYYFAPLEGITGHVYRQAHKDYFEPADKYFSPFIVPKPNTGRLFGTKELTDILPEHNEGLYLVPQIMSNKAQDFIKTAKGLQEYGYHEVNLNLGCPSRTVVSKGRGSGFLAMTEELDAFLDEIFSALDMKISIKTRIGKDTPEEFERILEIYNQYPMEELIIHPRIQQEYYKGKPHMEVFDDAVRQSKHPLCYNGDIFRAEDYQTITANYPELPAVMLGRGVLANPALIGEIKGTVTMDKQRFRAFHDRLLGDYQELFFGDKNALFKMKEFWCYTSCLFTNPEKYAKKIRKSETMRKYLDVVDSLFAEQELEIGAGFRW